MLSKRLDIWLPTYMANAPRRALQRVRRASQHTHIIFLICDHFEPRHGADTEQAAQRMKTWRASYADFQQRCRKEFGKAPLHSWFYPPHHGTEHLAALSTMAHEGLGEVELHYHHDGDTEAKLERDLRQTLAEYNRWGLLLESGERPRASFGFVHGDWALCNSLDGKDKYCGVNNELNLLQKLGCWADFTMPSGGPCQTRKINSIYYAGGDPRKPKSHDWGTDAQAGKPDAAGLMLMQGPMGINFSAPRYPRIENASLTSANWGRPDRIRKWVDCNVHVRNRPEWVFVKLHTHGAIEQDFDSLFGDKAMQMHRVLNQQYNDGKRYSLHYATARQAFNVAKAAEHGHGGNPADYFDFRIPLPATSFYSADARHVLEHCTSDRLVLSAIEQDRSVQIRTRLGPIASLRGPVSRYEIDVLRKLIHIEAGGMVEMAVRDNAPVDIVSGGVMKGGDGRLRQLEVSQTCTLRYS
ncbi:hypothetical protein BH11PSE11_BH11PSE11_36610 [soil metagenome]